MPSILRQGRSGEGEDQLPSATEASGEQTVAADEGGRIGMYRLEQKSSRAQLDGEAAAVGRPFLR